MPKQGVFKKRKVFAFCIKMVHLCQSQPLGWVFFYDSFEADRMLKTYF